MKTLAERISGLINQEKADSCYFAADPRINQPILDEMDATARGKIQKNILANLSKLDPEEISKRFCEEE